MSKTVIYIFHLLLVFLSWGAPFLVSWYIIVPIYLLVVIQFVIFGRCLLNKAHDLHDEGGGDTIYSYFLESINVHVDKRRLKRFIYRTLYFVLSIIAVVWQVILGFEPLWFFK